MRSDWKADFTNNQVSGVHLICPHCQIATTFSTAACTMDQQANVQFFYAILRCNHAACRRYVYVATTKASNFSHQTSAEALTIFPPGPAPKAHQAVPTPIGQDWIEAQVAYSNGAAKAAAVMCRRVLYGVLLERKCKEHPLHEGISELLAKEKLPGIVEEWLGEIKEEGHDAAHPSRALTIPAENVEETMGYTKELLRFVYEEPYELQQRLARKAAQTKTI